MIAFFIVSLLPAALLLAALPIALFALMLESCAPTTPGRFGTKGATR
jgi:hypothetical protein